MELTIDQAIQKGVTAHKAGRLQEAKKYYRAIISRQAQHPDANHNLGVLAVGVGKVKEALPYFKIAVEGNPEQGQFWLSYIDALIKLGRMDDARQVLEQGKRLGLKGDQVNALETRLNGSTISTSPVIESNRPDQQQLNNLISLYTQGNLQEALVQGSALSKQFPVDPDIPNILGATNIALNKYTLGKLNYTKAILIKPEFSDAYNNLANALFQNKHYGIAEKTYRQALVMTPSSPPLHNNLGECYKILGKFQKAIDHFNYVNTENSTAKILECLFTSGRYEDVRKSIMDISQVNQKNIRVAAISAFVSHQLNEPDYYPFCKDPLQFFHIGKIRNYLPDESDFLTNLSAQLRKVPSVWNPQNKTTKNGFQTTGNIFDISDGSIDQLEQIIKCEIDLYYEKYKKKKCDFIRLWPSEIQLQGWYVRLVENGYQKPHIHPTGWLSGVIYLETVNAENTDAGAIELSLHGYDLPILRDNVPKKIHRPRNGDIILFPSSCFHRTIPFREKSERCVIAFDVMG